MELREFVAFHFSFVKTSLELGKRLPKEAMPVEGTDAMTVLRYSYSEHRPFLNQVMLSRAVESFDLYLTTALRDVFLAKPQLLKSEGAIDVASIIEAGSYEELIGQIVERKVHDLSYKSLTELRKFISSRTGVDAFPSEEAFQMTLIASEVRNLIAHNDCLVNDIYRRRVRQCAPQSTVFDTGRLQIEDEWLRRASYTLDGIVFRFDEMTAAKFDLHTLNRMGPLRVRS